MSNDRTRERPPPPSGPLAAGPGEACALPCPGTRQYVHSGTPRSGTPRNTVARSQGRRLRMAYLKPHAAAVVPIAAHLPSRSPKHTRQPLDNPGRIIRSRNFPSSRTKPAYHPGQSNRCAILLRSGHRPDRRVSRIRCARLTGERQGVRVPRNEGVTNHVSPRAVRRSSRGVRRSVGSGSCGRAVEHRKGTCPGCRGFRIGRRQHRWPRYGERSASPRGVREPMHA